MSRNKSDFFSFGNNLFNNKKGKSAEKTSSEQTSDEDLLTCTVCSSKISTSLCPNCGFDNSRNYEQYPSLQKIEDPVPAISLFKALWNPPDEPSVEQSLALLENQKWDEHVLDAVEEILKNASNGAFTESHRIYIRDINAPDEEEFSFTHKFCAVCGTCNDINKPYCLNCGAKLSSKRSFMKRETNYMQPLPKFCKKCGHKNLGEAIYCAVCGAKIG